MEPINFIIDSKENASTFYIEKYLRRKGIGPYIVDIHCNMDNALYSVSLNPIYAIYHRSFIICEHTFSQNRQATKDFIVRMSMENYKYKQ